MASAALAIVIVTYDSAGHIGATLDALRPQLEPGDELCVVDCASPAGPPTAEVARHAPTARLIALAENAGFAGGANVGAATTTAPLILLLNPDCVAQPGALAALRASAEAQPRWGCWQALVTLPGGGEINTSGGITHWLGFGWTGEYGAAVPPAGAALREVSFASGAACVVRREAWDAVGGFDPDYFMYAEDVDLSFRLRLAGWGVGVVLDARVEHDYGFTKGDYKWFLLERNRWWTVLATYPSALLWPLLPALLGTELVVLVVAARSGWLPAKLRAQAAVLRSLPRALARRRRVQATRRIPASAFAGYLSARLDSPFLDAAAAGRLPQTLQAAYWRVVVRWAERSPNSLARRSA
ncbi:glycosyltransferase family 2 protein [Candidatus Solirubrobacter pratensis]|uniref:glycosyltransferase family 2 protein n=1 Tax=Candidatus Solirubrobacter pratensis TaxID=1298857 RepID=UPI000400FFFF|nr:glycosyltransferase family 2 protein [Candidatus Solirubrobacter pratensis]